MKFLLILFCLVIVFEAKFIRPKRCLQDPDKGKCSLKKLWWYFNQKSGKCEQFVYSGCGGNSNNFPTFT
ncbi:Kunitz/Bovine pancreatic trypsin inhibitor domain protein, partial [Necator americanus]